MPLRLGFLLLLSMSHNICSRAQTSPAPASLPAAPDAQSGTATQPEQTPVAPSAAVRLDVPHSYNPLNAYRPTLVPEPVLSNSPRLETLIHDGVLELSLNDAINLALENNLDLAIARYNIPIAEADVLRTKAGASFRGVNTGIVQNTPGGGIGGFGTGAAGAGAGGTTGGSGGAGAGASGLVQSTLGTGTLVNSYDPVITADINTEHYAQPLANTVTYGVPLLQANTITANFNYVQSFPTGTTLQFQSNNRRFISNSPFNLLNPELDSYYQVLLQQQLLAGFGFGPNLRYLRIARNNQKISDQAFALQVATTVTQIANIYWDLVSAYEDEQVKSRSLDFANQTLSTARKQLDLQAIPAVDVLKDEGEVAAREQDLTIARSQLRFQELLIKNAVTKNLDDPLLERMPVRPLDLSAVSGTAAGAAAQPAEDLIQEALTHRIELGESEIDLQSRGISRSAARNAVLPSLALIGYYGGSGLAGLNNPVSGSTSTAPPGFGGAFQNAFNNTAPDYFVGLRLDLPLRNRVAKSDQYRSELEDRQAELRFRQLRKQIRIEVRNAQYALEQSEARVTSAVKARDLASRTFDITSKEQTLGAGSALQTLNARRDLSTAESNLVAARTAYQKARIELDRAIGATLETNHIAIASARSGAVAAQAARP